MKHLMTHFQAAKAHLFHIEIEYLHPSNMAYCTESQDSVSVMSFNFLDQVHDSFNDISVWGGESNFEGTITQFFSDDPIRNNGIVDEIDASQCFHAINEECKCVCRMNLF